MRARNDDLRSLVRLLDLDDVCLDAVAVRVRLRRDLLSRRQHGFRLAEVDVDVVVLDALDEARQDVTLAAHELLVDDAALCLADALDDDLLRRLSGDAAEIRRRHLDLDDVAYLVVRLDRAGLSQRDLRDLVLRVLDDRLDRVDMIVTRLSGKRDADILRRAKVALVSRDQGSLDGLEEDLFIDAFLLAELFERHQKFLTIVLRFRRFSCQNDILPNERGNAPFFCCIRCLRRQKSICRRTCAISASAIFAAPSSSMASPSKPVSSPTRSFLPSRGA